MKKLLIVAAKSDKAYHATKKKVKEL